MCRDTLFVECAATHHTSKVPQHTICRVCCDTPYVGCAVAQCVDCAVAHLFITTDFRILDLQVGTGKIHWNSRFIHSRDGHTFLSTAVDRRKSLYCNFLLLLLTYVFAIFFFLFGALSNAQVIDNSGLRGAAWVGAVYNAVSKYRELVGRLRELESSICGTQHS